MAFNSGLKGLRELLLRFGTLLKVSIRLHSDSSNINYTPSASKVSYQMPCTVPWAVSTHTSINYMYSDSLSPRKQTSSTAMLLK